MKRTTPITATLVAALFLTTVVRADIKLPALFSDHMVLQADTTVPVWGWASPGEEVSVSIAGQSATTTADANGKWMARLGKLKTGGPHVLSIKGQNDLAVQDVLVGEVWLGSGQSNMAMVVNASNNPSGEHAAAALPEIRMFTVASFSSDKPEADCKGSWVVCSPQSVGQFSATAYFMGRELHKALKVPVGLINSSVGGTPIESWISPEAQRDAPELKEFVASRQAEYDAFDPVKAKALHEKQLAAWKEAAAKAKAEGKKATAAPRDPIAMRRSKGGIGGLYNGKIAPLVPYAVRGVVWYQGEANTAADKAPLYQYQLPLLVRDWRSKWGYDMPFAWVQLPNFNGPGRNFPLVREAMLKSLSTPYTGMAIAIDIGDATDIHPKNKQDVGKRLAQWALGSVYGQPIETSGPLPTGFEKRGKEFVVSFSHADGLMSKGSNPKGFRVAGADNQWQPAAARIEGNKVIVSSSDVPDPVAVRYAWENNPECNLYNSAGLPASPFRSDNQANK